jgi:uncharacterized protein (TIGR02145 family)
MAQLLKKFDNVLLASMKKANNNPIPNTIRINGVLLPIGTPTPTQTPNASPSQTPTVTPTKTLTPTVTPTQTPTPTITKTQTPTPSITPTKTPTPTSNPVVPTCAVLYNDNQDKVYYYNVSANTSTLLTMPAEYSGGNDIAHTSNKLWEPIGLSFNEYNITLPSFSAIFNRNIPSPLNFSNSAGLAAISDTVILAVNTLNNPNEVVEIDVSGVSPVMTTKFPLTAGRTITGDFYKTTTNKFLVLNNDPVNEICYLSQWNYLTGTLEVDVVLTIPCNTYGIFESNGNIYITSVNLDGINTKLYIINKNSPYNLVYVTEINKTISGASQVPSCLTTNLNAPSPYLCSLNDVTIGTQTWTACNLNVPTYRDGTVIPKVTDPAIWSGLTTGAWCYYSGSTTTGNTYGMLYNWYAVNNTANGGLAPLGYHIPTDAEWTTLTTFLGGESVSGGILKGTGTTYWNTPNTGAVNTYGFTALPGGNRSISGVFTDIRNGGYWWTSSSANTVSSWSRQMSNSSQSVSRINTNKTVGFSVRLIKDVLPPSQTPTQTLTPTKTPTQTPTPTYTPTVTPTKAPIILNADYLVFTYTFPITSGKDLDTLTYLYVNNVTGTTYANTFNPVGFCTTGNLASGKRVGPNLWWGGDNQNTGGSESVYVDIKQLKLSGSVTSIQLNCRANWYRNTPNTGTGIVQIQMKAYSGGTMISDGNYGFITSGGTQIGTTYTFADSTILISNATCSGTDCVGFFTYTLSTGTFVKSNTCIP